MSKKQREKVEEEVSYHQNQNRIRAAGGPTSPDPWTGPDSTAPTEPIYTPQWTPMDSFTQHSNQWGTQIPNPTNNPTQLDRQFEEFTNVDSTTPAFDPPRISLTGEPESPGFPQGLKGLGGGLQKHHLTHPGRMGGGQGPIIKQEQGVEPTMEGTPTGHTDSFGNFVDSTTHLRPSPPLSGQEYCGEDPEKINQLVANSIFEAHQRTCLLSSDQIQEKWTMGVDERILVEFRNMASEDLWMHAAQKLTNVIQQIIEFAKMLPGFMKLQQDDQIVLLKSGSFELAVLRMSRYFDLSSNAVLFEDIMLPMEAFLTTGDTEEMDLVTKIFEFAKEIAELKLSEVILSLYSAFILLQDDRNGLRNLEEIRKLKAAVWAALQKEMLHNPPMTPTKGDVSTLSLLVNKRMALRNLSIMHLEVLGRFRRQQSTPPEFPALYGELFHELSQS